MRTSWALVIVGLAQAAAGCTGRDDTQETKSSVAGFYQTNAITLAKPCGAAPEPDTVTDPYFEVEDYGAFGISAWACTAADVSSCNMDYIAFVALAKPVGHGRYHTAEAYTVGNRIDGCTVDYYAIDVATTADGLEIRKEHHVGTAMGDDCGGALPSDAELNRFSMFPCDDVQLRSATRL